VVRELYDFGSTLHCKLGHAHRATYRTILRLRFVREFSSLLVFLLDWTYAKSESPC
jgi:hypothetical protein